ncbi:MAG TPA: pyridoxamine 5'-phosphate oxidase family protein [Syntrophorhabdaceae bacterium]
MTFEDCVRHMEKTPVGFLATVEGEKPHVRPMTVWRADQRGIYFYTSRVKPLVSQLSTNPHVEIAFHEPGVAPDVGTVLRIAGRMEVVEDMKIRQRLYETFTWLKEIGTGTPDSPTIAVFRISSGSFNFWRWEHNLNPGPWVPFP